MHVFTACIDVVSVVQDLLSQNDQFCIFLQGGKHSRLIVDPIMSLLNSAGMMENDHEGADICGRGEKAVEKSSHNGKHLVNYVSPKTWFIG